MSRYGYVPDGGENPDDFHPFAVSLADTTRPALEVLVQAGARWSG